MKNEEVCVDEQRRWDVRRHHLNGIDYVEVGDDLRSLTVYFLNTAPDHVKRGNVRIEGGVRVHNLNVIDDPRVRTTGDSERDDCMELTLNKQGDLSEYTLYLVEMDEHGRPRQTHLHGFDPRYAHIKFSFQAGCPSDLDCQPDEQCPTPQRNEPHINYLAKDFASFRQVILDRLALLVPDWQERHVPDLGIALVELLAYTGDYLSYYQDAVATEAYIKTARQRISVRRHARLVDYAVHEGCNARAWLCIEIDEDRRLPREDVYFITGHNNSLPTLGGTLMASDLYDIPRNLYEVFEPTYIGAMQLYEAHNCIYIYTWGDRECCLPSGATSATLRDDYKDRHDARTTEASAERKNHENSPGNAEKERVLHLRPGDIVMFEEVLGPRTGQQADSNPEHRQAVRLTSVMQGIDELYGQPILNIEWGSEDALQFPLCISSITEAPECQYLKNVSVARGNVILVDHGQTLDKQEDLGRVPTVEIPTKDCAAGCARESAATPGKFRPSLARKPLTFCEPIYARSRASASGFLSQNPRQAIAQVQLAERRGATPDDSAHRTWGAKLDLLESQGRDCHFVAEIDNDGLAHLRFGDGTMGSAPSPGARFTASYRVGNGIVGNVGAEAISHIVFRRTDLGTGIKIRNPMAATGGTEPEPLEDVRLFAPTAFLKEPQRAITADDYAMLAMRTPNIRLQQAAATLRWTGSWYEVRVAVDPLGTEDISQDLLQRVERFLYRYRRAEHDLVVAPASYVSLDIAISVCVQDHYLRGHIKSALLDVFSNRILPNGQQGLFHPDRLTFGTSIHLSSLIAAAQAVEGVKSVQVTKLQRLYHEPEEELNEKSNQKLSPEIMNGVLPVRPLEVPRLDNDPSFPEHGMLRLDVRGGR
jgi:hypothetical protein